MTVVEAVRPEFYNTNQPPLSHLDVSLFLVILIRICMYIMWQTKCSWLPTSALETGYVYWLWFYRYEYIYIYRDRYMTFLISGWNTMIQQSLHSPSFTLWRRPVRPLLFSQINVTYIHVHIHMHITAIIIDNVILYQYMYQHCQHSNWQSQFYLGRSSNKMCCVP